MSHTYSIIYTNTYDTIYLEAEVMTSMTLKEYVDKHGQVRTGVALGVTQIAISKALHSGREIHISIGTDGDVSAYEIKQFPARRGGRGRTDESWKLPNCDA